MTDVFAPTKITFRGTAAASSGVTLNLPPDPTEFLHALTGWTTGNPSTLTIAENLSTLYGLTTTPPNDKFMAIFNEIAGYATNTDRSITAFRSGPTSYCTVSADLLTLYGLKAGDYFPVEFTALPGGITGLIEDVKAYVGRIETTGASTIFTLRDVPTAGTYTSGGTIKVLITGAETSRPYVATVTGTGTFTIPVLTVGTYASGGRVIVRLNKHDRNTRRFMLERLEITASVAATPSTGGIVNVLGPSGLIVSMNTNLAANTSNNDVLNFSPPLPVTKLFGASPTVVAPPITNVTWEVLATGFMD